MSRPFKDVGRTSIVNGVYKCYNLAFLSGFMRESGLSTTDMASSIGVSRQTMHHYLSKDDMKLSTAETIFEAYGLRLFLELVPEGDDGSSGEQYQFDLDRFLANHRAGAGKRLSFLRTAMASEGFSYREVEERCGFGKTTLDYYFKQDDIYFAKLMTIVEKLGLILHVTISDKYSRKDLDDPEKRPIQLTHMELKEPSGKEGSGGA